MKKCTSCKEEKELEEFSKNKKRKDGLQTECKVCARKKHREYYAKNKEKQKKQIREAAKRRIKQNQEKICKYLEENPCVDCLEGDILVLEFDHLRDKDKNVSDMVREGYGWDRILEEIDKCEVRCSNCHKRKTAKQFNWYTYQYEISLGS